MNNTLKWFHVITKTIVHCLLGTIEYIGIPFLLACLSTFISPISSGNTLWLWIERIAFCFTIYEVIIVGVRKMQIDIRKDALLALKTAYERAALYCETGNQDIYRNLTSKIDQVLDNGILNQLDVVQSYKNLKLYMDSKNIVGIKYEIINIQHSIEADNLLWNYTLFLRLSKR